ncbi:ionotropic receptor 93a [Colias croceus]|uniref:ionotropic receptor 93a n=1 Tax=Colias crocea TaxID=72248 RepID=UPI001E27F3CA|nr:ionotropic receptor 93a [Colias croceus]
MQVWIIVLCLFGHVTSDDFPSLITANASIAVVLDHQFLQDKYQPILDELKDYIKELARVELKHGGVLVHYYSWTAINLKKGFLAVFSVASCEDTWSLFKRTKAEQLLLFALTEVDCPRLPSDLAITVTYTEPGEEVPQMILDLRTERAFNWKSVIMLHDNTLNRDMVSRVVQSLTSHIDDEDVPSVSVTVFKMKHEVNEYLRRKEMYRIISKLPVKYIGENFIAIVTSDVVTTMAETARDLGMSHTLAQWLYIVSDTSTRRGNLSNLINDLYEGENIAYIYNRTDVSSECQNGILCYCKELMNAFISALDEAVQEEFDVAAQVSDEEWEAIRPTKRQRRDMLLRHMQQHISTFSKCGNCSTWHALAADTWGATYRRQTDNIISNKEDNYTNILIEHVNLLQVGFWRPIDGIKFEDVLFPHIQHGFRGKELPILTYHNPPWTILQANASGAIISYGGLLFDIVGQLAKSKNFTIRIVLPGHIKEDSSNDTSTDMMHSTSAKLTLSAVARGKVAIAAAAITILSDPPRGINYTIPVSIQPYAFIIARPRELSRALLFLLPFTTDTWLCLGFAVILMGPTLFIIHRLSPYYDAMEITREGGLATIHNCLWYVYGALLQQGGMYLPRADSGRLVVGTWWIVVLVVVTTYSGNLVAFLTFPKLEIPITTISELTQSNLYTWSINKGSYLEMQLKNSDEPKYVSLLKGAEMTTPSGTDANLMTGSSLNRVRKERHVMIDWRLRLKYLMRADTLATDSCDFVLSSEEFMEERVAMIVPADSPYLPVINKEINRMQKAGLINKWLSAYLPKRDRCWQTSSSTREVNNHTVNLSDMQGSFFVLFLGVFSATTVLLSEWFYNRRKKKNERVVIKPYVE